MSEIHPGTQLTTFGKMVLIAVLLLLFATTGYYLMIDNSWSLRSMTTTAMFAAILIKCIVVARGSRQMPARLAIGPKPAPPRISNARPVQEATYIHVGVRLPMGEWLGLQA